MAKKIFLNELPYYSTSWIKRIFGIESWDVKVKSESEVIREFEYEKWGAFLTELKMGSEISLKKIQKMQYDSCIEQVFFNEGDFYVGDHEEIEKIYFGIIYNSLLPYLKGATALVELGAGFGSQILSLSKEREFQEIPLFAYEFTDSGQELIRIIAKSIDKQIHVGFCDFRNLVLGDDLIPKDAIIFTSYAAHYVPEVPKDFVGFLSKLKPRAIIHFEPCYEHHSLETLHGILCRRYIELNDYARNLVAVFKDAKSRGDISYTEQQNVFGSNPLLPISVIKWEPTKKC
jgi:hypothetical protein